MVDDLRAYLDKAMGLGATEILPPMAMGVEDSKFSIAGFIDPEGNYNGLFHNGEGLTSRKAAGDFFALTPPLTGYSTVR